MASRADKASDPSKLIDRYIAGLPEFSRAICTRLRAAIRKSDRKIAEDWKWGPNFNRGGMICGMSAHKKWVRLDFFRGSEMKDRRKLFKFGKDNDRMRSIRFADAAEVKKLEPKLREYVREAVKLNLKPGKPKRKIQAKKPVVIPPDLKAALRGLGLFEQFESLPYYMRRDYVHWITSPKRMETRLHRIEQLVQEATESKGWRRES